MEFELFLGNSHDYSYLGAKYYMKRKKYTWDDGTSQLNKTAPDSCAAFLSSAHIDNVTFVQFMNRSRRLGTEIAQHRQCFDLVMMPPTTPSIPPTLPTTVAVQPEPPGPVQRHGLYGPQFKSH